VLWRRGVSAGTQKTTDIKTEAIYFSHSLRPPEPHLTLNGRNIPFVNHKISQCNLRYEDYMETTHRND
jgi:hypothetical protein